MVNTLAKGCSAFGPTRIEPVGDEPLSQHVAAVVGHVLGPVLAHRGVAAVAAVSGHVAEAARGRVRHDPVVVEGNPALRVRLVKSAQLFIGIWHDIGITKSFFQRVQISTPDCGISEASEH